MPYSYLKVLTSLGISLSALALFSRSPLYPVIPVGNEMALQDAIIDANNAVDTEIIFTGSFDYSRLFQPLNATNVLAPAEQSFTINGGGNTLTRMAGDPYRGFFIRSAPDTDTITIQDLTINNAPRQRWRWRRRRNGRRRRCVYRQGNRCFR